MQAGIARLGNVSRLAWPASGGASKRPPGSVFSTQALRPSCLAPCPNQNRDPTGRTELGEGQALGRSLSRKGPTGPLSTGQGLLLLLLRFGSIKRKTGRVCEDTQETLLTSLCPEQCKPGRQRCSQPLPQRVIITPVPRHHHDLPLYNPPNCS